MEKIIIGSDHAGFNLKSKIIIYLKELGYEVFDNGVNTTEPFDYPYMAKEVAKKVAEGEFSKGILICGSGIGMSIAANKVKGVRCGRVTSIKDVIATRNDNDANVISFAGYLNEDRVIRIIETFIETPAGNDERHLRRINKISKYENQ